MHRVLYGDLGSEHMIYNDSPVPESTVNILYGSTKDYLAGIKPTGSGMLHYYVCKYNARGAGYLSGVFSESSEKDPPDDFFASSFHTEGEFEERLHEGSLYFSCSEQSTVGKNHLIQILHYLLNSFGDGETVYLVMRRTSDDRARYIGSAMSVFRSIFAALPTALYRFLSVAVNMRSDNYKIAKFVISPPELIRQSSCKYIVDLDEQLSLNYLPEPVVKYWADIATGESSPDPEVEKVFAECVVRSKLSDVDEFRAKCPYDYLYRVIRNPGSNLIYTRLQNYYPQCVNFTALNKIVYGIDEEELRRISIEEAKKSLKSQNTATESEKNAGNTAQTPKITEELTYSDEAAPCETEQTSVKNNSGIHAEIHAETTKQSVNASRESVVSDRFTAPKPIRSNPINAARAARPSASAVELPKARPNTAAKAQSDVITVKGKAHSINNPTTARKIVKSVGTPYSVDMNSPDVLLTAEDYRKYFAAVCKYCSDKYTISEYDDIVWTPGYKEITSDERSRLGTGLFSMLGEYVFLNDTNVKSEFDGYDRSGLLRYISSVSRATNVVEYLSEDNGEKSRISWYSFCFLKLKGSDSADYINNYVPLKDFFTLCRFAIMLIFDQPMDSEFGSELPPEYAFEKVKEKIDDNESFENWDSHMNEKYDILLFHCLFILAEMFGVKYLSDGNTVQDFQRRSHINFIRNHRIEEKLLWLVKRSRGDSLSARKVKYDILLNTLGFRQAEHPEAPGKKFGLFSKDTAVSKIVRLKIT